MSEDDKDERFYRDTEAIAYPKLDDWQLALLEPLGHRRMLRRGELVFKAGQRDLGLTVVLSGEVEAFAALDRFAAGVTNSVEVVQSQETVASAERDYVSTLFSLNLARISLARATGQAERFIPNMLKGN
jgi:CRP-like cAMP-binding protein